MPPTLVRARLAEQLEELLDLLRVVVDARDQRRDQDAGRDPVADQLGHRLDPLARVRRVRLGLRARPSRRASGSRGWRRTRSARPARGRASGRAAAAATWSAPSTGWRSRASPPRSPPSAGSGPRPTGRGRCWCRARRARPSTTAARARPARSSGHVDLDDDLALEVLARVEVEVGVGGPGEAVDMHAWVHPRYGLIVQRNGIRERFGTALIAERALTSWKRMPSASGASKVRTTAGSPKPGSARSPSLCFDPQVVPAHEHMFADRPDAALDSYAICSLLWTWYSEHCDERRVRRGLGPVLRRHPPRPRTGDERDRARGAQPRPVPAPLRVRRPRQRREPSRRCARRGRGPRAADRDPDARLARAGGDRSSAGPPPRTGAASSSPSPPRAASCSSASASSCRRSGRRSTSRFPRPTASAPRDLLRRLADLIEEPT